MATALIGGLLAAGRRPDSLRVADSSADARHRLLNLLPADTILSDASGLGDVDVLVLAVKPQDAEALLASVAATPPRMILSVAAGWSTDRIERSFPAPVPVIRAMPNTPALIRQGITVVARGRHARDHHAAAAREILATVGEVLELPEDAMDAVTAISGSGPAYFFLFLRELLAAGVSLGLDEATARQLVLATASGTVALARSGDESLDDRIAAVASKGGTTERALAVFRERGLGEIVSTACRAARDRAGELGR